jgi:branched-subunit amino acid aminotransferase/4-amino-4-deoxychorismate lyase
MEPIVYLNGELLPISQAKLPITDRGFLYGDGLFETLRTYGRRPFLLSAHLRRLRQGASYLQIPLSLSERELVEAVASVVEANSSGELYLRITLTRGSGGRGLLFPAPSRPTLLIEARALAEPAHAGQVAAISVSDCRSSLVFLKSLNFLPNLLAREAAVEKEAFEALFVDHEGFVWEGTVSNLFLVFGGKLVTPPTAGRVLPGVTRELVMSLAAELQVGCEERSVEKRELFEAQGVFLTNSLIGIVTLHSIDGRILAVEGRVTRSLQAKYADFTRNFALGLP